MLRPYICNEITSHGFYRLLAEIDECLSHRLLLPALCCSLMIPDICGKVLYPKCKHVGFRYVAWYDEFQGKCDVYACDGNVISVFDNYMRRMKSLYAAFCDNGKMGKIPNWPTDFYSSTFCGIPGQAIYALRCSFLHSGSQSPDYDDRYSFVFTSGPVNINGMLCETDVIEVYSDDNIRCHISIDKFCRCLLRNSLSFFLEYFDDFANVDMNVVSADDDMVLVASHENDTRCMVHRCWSVLEEDDIGEGYGNLE